MWNCGPVGNNRCSYGDCIKRAFWRREVFWNYRWIKYVLVSQYISVIYVSVPSADPIFLSTSPFCLSLYFFFSLCFHFSFSPIYPPPYPFLFSLSPSPSPPISIFSISISLSLSPLPRSSLSLSLSPSPPPPPPPPPPPFHAVKLRAISRNMDFSLHVEAKKKWPPFCRRHFQTHENTLVLIKILLFPEAPINNISLDLNGSESCPLQMGPILAPRTLLSAGLYISLMIAMEWQCLPSHDTFGCTTKNHDRVLFIESYPDSKVHGANMGPIWGRQDPGGSHVGPMNFAIWVVIKCSFCPSLFNVTVYGVSILIWRQKCDFNLVLLLGFYLIF